MPQLVIASSNQQLDVLLEIVCHKLQLPKSLHDCAENRYHTIGAWLLAPGSAIRQVHPDVYPQGSLSLGTTVKPYQANEFDLDIVCELQVSADYHPGAVYQAIWDRMAEHETYRRMMKRMRRCIRLEYANQFHLDIVPAVPDEEESGAHILVPDLHADLAPRDPRNDVWKPSNPRDYKAWYKGKCRYPLKESRASAEPLPQPEPVHRKPSLKRATQLLKRWRDVEFAERRHLEPTSIILTTLAGHFHQGELLSSDALDSILNSIVDMRRRGIIICRTNPAHPKEDICERWRENPKALQAFDESVGRFHESWKRLMHLQGLKEITAELKRLFGENPVDQAVKVFVERHLSEPRANGKLVMERATGRIATGHRTSAAAPVAAAIAVKDTTFYGDR